MSSAVNVIVGAGQLGSRHLQGLLKHTLAQQIFVIDPSADSLEISKTRAEEISHAHQVTYCQTWNGIPQHLNLVIVATNSMVREKIVHNLLENYRVSFLVLEKVLFPEVEAYKRVAALLQAHNVKTWVNHPRRMFQSYADIKARLQRAPFSFQVSGGNWGLGCNGLHFIDLCMFLTSSSVQTLDAEWVDDSIIPSKRKGFVEFTGTVKGKMINGTMFQITSFTESTAPLTITLSSEKEHWIIHESGNPRVVQLGENEETLSKTSFHAEFQSALTTRILDDLIKTSDCALTQYSDAMNAHLFFIAAFLKKYSEVANVTSNVCPIT